MLTDSVYETDVAIAVFSGTLGTTWTNEDDEDGDGYRVYFSAFAAKTPTDVPSDATTSVWAP